MKKGDTLCGFEVLDVVPVPDCASTGIYLRHKTKEMEVFHLLNDDAENLFAFAFRTPAKDSTGVAHVIEHSVLCGSERYPLKDPFIRLANQSIKTYLNAYTSSDHTVFPASSQIKADYFNLMGVYSDAVFFPLLRKEIFMQEGHRLEYDADGKPCIQGVVYNEMKGLYSSFDSVANDVIDGVLCRGTDYANDSGGKPMEIPSLSYGAFRRFHKKHYCPANCCLFLYGNIPTEEQLAFVKKSVLDRIPDGGRAYRYPQSLKPLPVEPVVHASGPADSDGVSGRGKDTAVLAWRLPPRHADALLFPMEVLFLGDLLWGDDCAPVAKALLESGLGDDLAPQSGEDIHAPIKSMCVGLRGVAAADAKKVQSVILRTLSELCRNGISRDDIERTSMRFSFSTQEIRRFNGPYSLVYLRRSLRGWLYGEKPWLTLGNKEAISTIIGNIASDDGYIQRLIRELLLDNTERSLVVVRPSASWSKARAKKELSLARTLSDAVPREQTERALRTMHRFQEAAAPDELSASIPHLSVAELSPDFERIDTRVTDVQGIPLFVNQEETNGIIYADVAFPVDVLRPSDYRYLSTLSNCLVESGWKDRPWNEALSLVHSVTGGFGAYIRHAHAPSRARLSADANKAWFDREWLVFHFKVLEQKAEEAFDLLSECICGSDFSDTERLGDIISGFHNDGLSSVLPGGHAYAAMRSQCTRSRSAAVTEIIEGLSSLYCESRIASAPAKKTAAVLRRMLGEIRRGGAVLHVTAGKKGIAVARSCLPRFICRTALVPPQKRPQYPDEAFYALTRIPAQYRVRGAGSRKDRRAAVSETFIIPGTVGFLGASFTSSAFDTRQCMADEVFCHSAETHELWQAIRTEGGAYGVMLSPDSDSEVSRLATFRDPDPYRSLEAVRAIFSDLPRKHFSDDEVEKAVIGCYSVEIEPRVPSATGATGFLWRLYGLTNAQKRRRLSWLTGIQGTDMHRTAVRYEKAVRELNAVVLCGEGIIGSKNEETTGIIYKLPV